MSEYYVKSIKPYELTNDDALEMGEILVDAWKDSPMKLLIGGPQNSNNTSHIKDIPDPSQRAKAIIRNAKLRQYLVHSRSLLVRSWILDKGCLIMACLKRNADGNRDRIVGMLMLQAPEPLKSEIDKAMGRDGSLKWLFYKKYVELSVFLQRIWSSEIWYWPSILRRIVEHVKFVHSAVDELIKTEQEIVLMPGHEVENAVYPRDKMVYVGAVGTHPDFQGQGVGSLLMESAFDTIENVPTVFEYNGKTAIGPQKWCLDATHAGKKLYLQQGFISLKDLVRPDDNRVQCTFMVKTR